MKLQGPMLELSTAKYSIRETKSHIDHIKTELVQPDYRIDVIDCSNIDQNIHKLRHNYYMLNTQVVEDICELVGLRTKAINRGRLVRVQANVFNFLCPPADLIDL